MIRKDNDRTGRPGGENRKPRNTDGQQRGARSGFGDKKRPFGTGDSSRSSFSGPKRPYGDRPRPYNDRPRGEGSENGERTYNNDRPRGNFGDRPRPFGDRPRGNFGGGFNGPKRPYGDRPRGNFGDRPRPEGSEGGERTYNNDRPRSNFGDRPRPFGDRPRGNFAGGFSGPKRPYGEGSYGSYREAGNRPDRDSHKKTGIQFGNKKSVFLSQEKREAIESEEKQQQAESQDRQQQRHESYEGRYEDRMRSAENLSKRRVERNVQGDGGYQGKSYSARPSAARPRSAKKEAEEGMRLNKFIAHSGVCSRREADMYIAAGSVQVNGVVVTEMGHKVMPSDEVRFDGVGLKAEKKVYVLLNKPKNYITTTDDPDDRHTVMELVKNAAKERIYPVGRLDRTTMGLLLFTNDGELARGVMHPSSNIKKTYHVTLDKSLSTNDMGAIRGGVELEDGLVEVDDISYIPDAPHKEVGIEIHTGRNRIVRRIFEHLGYQVSKLDRVQLGPLTKKNLTRGDWRHLTPQEVSLLKMIASGKKIPATENGEYGLE